MDCLNCGGTTHKRGVRNGKQRIRCIKCGTWDMEYLSPRSMAKILLFDIETTPMEVFVWGLIGNKYINHDNIINDWNVLSWSAKWLCDSKVMSDIQRSDEAIERDDKRVLNGIWKLIDQADIVITQNGNAFDIKKLNTRFKINGYPPPSSFQSIDTLLVAKRNFAFSSNKLDYMSKIMIRRGKIETNFDLWRNCLLGDKKALKKMQKYNEEDVRLLEEVYIELRPWIKSHPNVGIYIDGEAKACPTCGSENIRRNGSYYTTTVNQYQSYSCNNCGSHCRELKGIRTLNERQSLMRAMPR